MINFSCPGCQATFKLPDEIAGKTARCSKCNQRFTVPGGKPKPAPAAPAAMPAAPAAASPPPPPNKAALNPTPQALEAEVLEAEVIDEPIPPPRRPAQRARATDDVDVVDEVQEVDEAAIQESPRRGRKPAPAYDEDDDDDRRRPRRRDRDDRDRDDWDDDEDPDRPRRKRRREGSGNSKMGVIMASIGGGAFVMMIVSFVGMTMSAQPRVVVNNAPFNMNPRPPMQFNPVPGPPNQGQPNPMQPNQGQPNQGQPNQGQPNVGAGGAIQLVNGSFETQDQLTQNDAIDNAGKNIFRKGSRAKRYSLQLEAGKTYVIDLIKARPGEAFDPYLRLEFNGTNLLEDDDGGANLNSRIVFQPQQAGNYTIVATSLGPATGHYRLTVRTQ